MVFFRNSIHVNLAMQCIANIGSRDMAEAFGYDIPKLLVSGYVYFIAPTKYLKKMYINFKLVCIWVK